MLKRILSKLENSTFVISLKRGLIEVIPILMIGSFALALSSIPIPVYQQFITTWYDGILYSVFDCIYGVTFMMISIYVTISMSYQIALIRNLEKVEVRVTWTFSSMAAYFILMGVPGEDMESFGPKGLFIALFSVYLASKIFFHVESRMKTREMLARGLDARMGHAIRLILPTFMVVACFVLINQVLTISTGTETVFQLSQEVLNGLFGLVKNQTVKEILIILVSDLLWFFGIHGNGVLESALNEVFVPTLEAGGAFINRGFLFNFIFMGGSGATICLMIAIMLFTKKKSIRNIGKMGIVPAIFNINELFVYGLPIIYNPFLFVPFVGVPLLCFVTSFISMKTGIVPPPLYEVEWTTPVILSGYFATGSMAGAVLQIINITLGVLCYVPFIRMYEKNEAMNTPNDYKKMKEFLIASEEAHEVVVLSDHPGFGLTAKGLIADLTVAMKKGKMTLFYQPQINMEGQCAGAEALLRWEHETLGYIYPPLVFKLAEEGGLKLELDKMMVRQALSDAEKLQKIPHMKEQEISVNVTPQSIQNVEFEKFLLEEADKFNVKKLHFCIEITEQAAIEVDGEMAIRLKRLCEAGYRLAVDDFSMGSTSIKYLTSNNFKEIKIDGYLVRQIMENERCHDIVAHIISMSKSLKAVVVAEYVETEEIFEKLKELGCDLYQGWYFSKAIPLEEYINNYGNLSDFVIK